MSNIFHLTFIPFLLLIAEFQIDSEKVYFSRDYICNKLSTKLIYNSNVGEVKAEITPFNSGRLLKATSDKFEYTQKWFFKNDSIFVDSIYQSVDFLVFFSKTRKLQYPKPFLRFPDKFSIGDEWSSEAVQKEGRRIRKIIVTTKALREEELKIEGRKFNTIVFRMTLKDKHGIFATLKEWRCKNIGIVKMTAKVK